MAFFCNGSSLLRVQGSTMDMVTKESVKSTGISSSPSNTYSKHLLFLLRKTVAILGQVPVYRPSYPSVSSFTSHL